MPGFLRFGHIWICKTSYRVSIPVGWILLLQSHQLLQGALRLPTAHSPDSRAHAWCWIQLHLKMAQGESFVISMTQCKGTQGHGIWTIRPIHHFHPWPEAQPWYNVCLNGRNIVKVQLLCHTITSFLSLSIFMPKLWKCLFQKAENLFRVKSSGHTMCPVSQLHHLQQVQVLPLDSCIVCKTNKHPLLC